MCVRSRGCRIRAMRRGIRRILRICRARMIVRPFIMLGMYLCTSLDLRAGVCIWELLTRDIQCADHMRCGVWACARGFKDSGIYVRVNEAEAPKIMMRMNGGVCLILGSDDTSCNERRMDGLRKAHMKLLKTFLPCINSCTLKPHSQTELGLQFSSASFRMFYIYIINPLFHHLLLRSRCVSNLDLTLLYHCEM